MHFTSGLSTEELSEILKVRANTIRRGLCTAGHYCGLRPVKLPNRRLIWNQKDVEALLVSENLETADHSSES